MRTWIRFTIIALLAVFISGCLGPGGVDSDSETPQEASLVRPVVDFPLPDTIDALQEVANLGDSGAQGVWVLDGLAYLSGAMGLRIYDVADPEDPILLAENITGSQRDVEAFHHPYNNKTYVVMGDNSDIMTFVDVTDPTDPFIAAEVEGVVTTHNIAVVPGTAVVYNSRSISTHTPEPGFTGQTDIVDFSDPENPEVHVFEFPAVAMVEGGAARPVTATTCHDVTFNEELERAYCAGVTQTLIWDVSDPVAPQILQVVDWPGTNIHHGAWDAQDGDILILGDEFAGVAAPTPMCSDTVAYPTSAIWFFDISDLSLPTPLGYYQVEWDALGASVDAGSPIYCSTHFGSVIEDRDLFVVGWYTAGTVLIDFSDPSAPFAVDHHHHEGGSNVWDAHYWNGHVFTGDSVRGMDVLRLAGDGIGNITDDQSDAGFLGNIGSLLRDR